MKASSVRDELAQLGLLSGPLIISYAGNTAITFVQSAIVGHSGGEVPLAAFGVGGQLFAAALLFGMGVMLGLDPLVSQAVGAREHRRARSLWWQGITIAVLVSVVLVLVLVALAASLEKLGVDPTLVPLARSYVYARLLGLPLWMLTVGTRGYLQARGSTRPMLVGVVLANVVNVPATILLVHGSTALGVQGWGIVGAAWATNLCYAVQLATLVTSIRWLPLAESSPGDSPSISRVPERELIMRALRLGIPIGFQILAEVGVFSFVGIMMGVLGAKAAAAHQVALQLVALTFQVPLAIGAATSVRVGRAVAQESVQGVRRAGLTAITLGAGFMVLTAILFLSIPEPLGFLMTSDVGVVRAAVPLLFVGALFQLGDGVQAVAAGALRGAGDTVWPLVWNVAGHYIVGLPLGVWLAFVMGRGAQGLWWGLSAGLTLVAIALLWRFVRLSRRTIARV